MIKVEHIETFGWEAAIRGMRNPMNSWNKSDTKFSEQIKKPEWCGSAPNIGKNDLDLMSRLYKAGTEHRKYLRMIHVQMDVTAPLFLWKQIDTYKIGVTANSTSTMHKIMDHKFTFDDFSFDTSAKWGTASNVNNIIQLCNDLRDQYLRYDEYAKTHDMHGLKKKDVWMCLIELLPSAYNQLRTLDMNYENVFSIIKQRENHKLALWREFCEILKSLPYVKEIGGFAND